MGLILGDNLFYRVGLSNLLKANNNLEGGILYAYHVNNPEKYGVVESDDNNNVLSIEVKPLKLKYNYAVPGIYFYDNDLVEVAKNIKPSKRGELKITEINNIYLKKGKLSVKKIERCTAWLATETFASLKQAGQFEQVIEERQVLKVGSIEAAVFKAGFITRQEMLKITKPLQKSRYANNLLKM